MLTDQIIFTTFSPHFYWKWTKFPLCTFGSF